MGGRFVRVKGAHGGLLAMAMLTPLRVVVAGVATTAYFGGVAGAYTWWSQKNKGSNDDCCQPITTETRCTTFNAIAHKYDHEISMDETLMGVNLLRRWLLRTAEGEVLECGCGTGRNFSYNSGLLARHGGPGDYKSDRFRCRGTVRRG